MEAGERGELPERAPARVQAGEPARVGVVQVRSVGRHRVAVQADDERLADAQRTLDTHVTLSASGRCAACGSFGPCPTREGAVVAFVRSTRLPRRRPGASRPDLVAVGGRQYRRRW